MFAHAGAQTSQPDSLSVCAETGVSELTQADAMPTQVSVEQLWEEANAAYINAEYQSAQLKYEQICQQGKASAKLYYNLANACYKNSRIGKAILYYHRALRLSPASEDIRYNLEVAEAQTKDKIQVIPEFFLNRMLRWVRNGLSSDAWAWLSLVLFALIGVSFTFYMLSRRIALRKTGFFVMLACAVLAISSALFASSARREALDRSGAVVISSAISVKSSPDRSAKDIFVLHEGCLVKVLSEVDECYEISIADGKKGWVDSSSVERI